MCMSGGTQTDGVLCNLKRLRVARKCDDSYSQTSSLCDAKTALISLRYGSSRRRRVACDVSRGGGPFQSKAH